MAQDAQRRVQSSFDNLLKDLDSTHLRSMQRDMHLCAAKCCENPSMSMETVQNCMERCSSRIEHVQKLVQNEMNSFQNRLERCGQSCQDQIKDDITTNTKEGDLPVFQAKMETCIIKCADDHIQLLPKIGSKLKDSISQTK